MAQATYTYKVRDNEGKLIEGSLDADSPALVVNKLRQMGYVPISIDAKQSVTMKKEIKIPGFGNRVPLKELAVFSRQFATLIDAGLTLLRSLAILAEQTENSKLCSVLTEVRMAVERGFSLSKAVAQHPKVFNRLYVAMIRAGETGGSLDKALLALASTIEKQVELRGKIKSAMAYPVIVLCMVLLIAGAMILFIVPVFKNIYKSLGGTLPKPTLLLIDISNIAVHFFPFVILGAVAFAFGFRRALRTERGRLYWDSFRLKVPVFGRLAQKSAISRFASTLSSLLRSGVPVLEGLDIARETVGNVVVAKGVTSISDGARRGEPLTKALEHHPVFPSMIAQMMSVGEETGSLDDMLFKAAKFLDDEIERMVETMTALLEPLMIMVLGSIVGSMVIALYLPMFNAAKLVNGG